MTTRILFVCLGNICRSPTAEAVTRAKALERKLDLEIDSAGTGDWHVGQPPYGPMQAAAALRGYDLSALRARQIQSNDRSKFDLVIGMDATNLAVLRRLSGPAALAGFTDFLDRPGTREVPDPYYTRDFDGALDLIELCAEGLLDHIAQREGATGM